MDQLFVKYPHPSPVYRAGRFADRCHAGQVRKYTGVDYIEHPIAVATMVSKVTGDQDVIAAALLHDVVEDCSVSVYQISQRFGNKVAAFVGWLTHVDPLEGEPRAARKARDRDKLLRAPAEVKTIKLADMIHNSETIIKYDPKFAIVFMMEMKKLLGVLETGDPGLYAQADKIVQDYYDARGQESPWLALPR